MDTSESRLRRKFNHFRILIIGRANAGKTTILRRVCKTRDNPEIYDSAGKKIDASVLAASRERGEHDIENEMVFRTNPGFVFHDSRGFEAGGQSEFNKVKAFIASRSKTRYLRDRIHVIWYCIPMDEDARSFTEAEVKFFSQCDTGSIPVIVLFTKFDALYDDIHAELMSKGISRKNADGLAPQHARESFANGPQLKLLYSRKGGQRPPRCHICLPDMDKDDADCTPLIEHTVETLNDDTLKQLFVSTQRTNLEVCIRWAVIRTLAQQVVSTQTVSSRIFGKFEESKIVDELGAWFPQTSRYWVNVLILCRARASPTEHIADPLTVVLGPLVVGLESHCPLAHKEMWSTLRSLASGSSSLENIVQFGSAAVIIFEHSFRLWDQPHNSSREYVHPIRVALQQYMASPNAAAVREALSSTVHRYQANARSIAGFIHRSQKKAEFIQTILEVILQHRLSSA